MSSRKNPQPHEDPTYEAIREACEQIQSSWSDAERRKRAGLPKKEHWNPPIFHPNQMNQMDAEVDTT